MFLYLSNIWKMWITYISKPWETLHFSWLSINYFHNNLGLNHWPCLCKITIFTTTVTNQSYLIWKTYWLPSSELHNCWRLNKMQNSALHSHKKKKKVTTPGRDRQLINNGQFQLRNKCLKFSVFNLGAFQV